jgi:hypothetical protein
MECICAHCARVGIGVVTGVIDAGEPAKERPAGRTHGKVVIEIAAGP